MLLRFAFRNACRNRRRTLVTLVTVLAGASALAIFQGFNYGINRSNRIHTIRTKYGHGQVMTQGYRLQTFEKPWQHWIQDPSAVQRVLAQRPDVVGVFPRVSFFALISNGRTSIAARGLGVDGAQEAKFFNAARMIEGSQLNAVEDGIVLGSGLAKALAVKVGDTVTVVTTTVHGSMNAQDFSLVGVSEIGLKEVDDSSFQVQIVEAQSLLDTQSVEVLSLGLREDQAWGAVAKEVDEKFAGLEAVPFEIMDAVWYQHTVDWLEQQFHVIRIIILSIIMLGIFNTATNAILERIREIGILRANGESRGAVLRLILYESVMVSALGAAVGLLLVVILAATVFRTGIMMPPPPGYTTSMRIPIMLSWPIAGSVFMLSVLVTVVATWAAGTRVLKSTIAQALRSV